VATRDYAERLATQYSPGYYEWQQAGARRSAAVVAPLLQERLRPRSIVDIGCGPGAWVATWRELGVTDAWGVDAAHVRSAGLLFPAECFVEHDLRLPLALERRFDLVLSLEVAQHLPEKHVPGFLDTLTGLGPAILFSAAVPHQGGDNHVNEQWQSWWAERLRLRGFEPRDVVRPAVWNDERVDWWYAQNALLYLADGDDSSVPRMPLDVVHPRNLLTRVEAKPPPLAQRLRRTVRGLASGRPHRRLP
jgi:SAM-dependent methyltransferase